MNGENLGFWVAVISGIILVAYGLVRGFREITEFDSIATILGIIFLIGSAVLLYSIIKEQGIGKKRMKKEIKKEDLEP